MAETKNEANTLLKNHLSKELNTDNKINSIAELNHMKKDLLYFKDDILKDVRLIEEKFNLKINEQNAMNSDQFNELEKKIEMLTNQFDTINSQMIDNLSLTEKISNIQSLKTKMENQLTSLGTKMNTFQKEYKDHYNKIEKLLDDNMRYPGIIGKNSRFSNFRKFIDYVLNYFKEFNEFRDEIRSFELNTFQKRINSDLKDFRYSISDGYQNSLTLIIKNKKEFDLKLEDALNKNKQIMEQNEKKFEELREKFIEDLSTYHSKFTNIENKINSKYNEQLTEINDLKNMFLDDINKIKADFDSIKKTIESKNENIDQLYNLKFLNNAYIPGDLKILKANNNINNYDNITEKKLLEENKVNNLPNNKDKLFITENGRNYFILKNILLNDKKHEVNTSQEKDINILNNYQISDEKNNTDKINGIENYSNIIMNKTHRISGSKSLEKLYDTLNLKKSNYMIDNYESINKKDQLSFTQDEIFNKKERVDIFNSILKNNIDNNNNIEYSKQKDVNKNNHHISNNSNIKIKKMILPEFLTKRNTKMRISNSSLSDNRRIQNISNNHSSSIKSILKEGVNNKRNFFDIANINRHKNNKVKRMLLVEPSETVNRSIEHKISNYLKSLKVMKIKQKKSVFNNLINLKKGEKRRMSFEIKEKKEKTQIGFKKTYYGKKFKDLLMNPKNIKTNRKKNL